jgi:hypothetical protein
VTTTAHLAQDGLRLFELHLTEALPYGLDALELLDDLMAGGNCEDLALNAHILQENYLEDRFPYPYSGDHITTAQAEARP